MADPLLDLIGVAPAAAQQQAGQQDPLLALVGAGMSQTASAPAPTMPTAPQTPLTRTDKLVRGLRDPIDGGAQLLTNLLPKGVVDAGNSLNNWIADKTGLVAKLPEGGVDQQVRERERQYQAQRAAQGESGFDGYRTMGNILSPANAAIATKIPAAASLAGRIGVGTAAGAGFGALTPIGEGDFADEKLKQIGIGGITGGLLPVATGALARMISPNASKNSSLQLLNNEGVQTTIGQKLGGVWNKAEEKLQSLPIVGDAITMARKSANSQFETAAYNRALNPIGEELPAGLSGRDALVHTENTLRDAYDNVLNRIGAITPDAKFSTKVADLVKMVNRQVMPKAEKAKFSAALSDVQQSIDANGVMTSDAYKALESSLGSDAGKLGASTNIYESRLAPAVKQLQGELRDMLDRQAGSNAGDLKAVNAGWANFKRVQNAAAKIGADDGNFTPAQFQNAVRATDKSKDKAAFARGSALGQDLGDAGKILMGSKVPDSGTAGRLALGGGALSAYMIDPIIPASLIGGAAMYMPAMQKLLGSAVSARPALAQPAAKALRKAAPMLVPGSAQFGFGLLN